MRPGLLGLAAIGVLIAGALVPLAGSAYLVDLAIRACTMVVLAVSWNLAASAGLISLGHAAFWGVGAYTGGLVVTGTQSVALGVVAGVVAAGAVGLLLGVVSARMRRFYFAIATLAYAEAFRVVAIGLSDVTGGSVGLFLPAGPGPTPLFYGVLGVAAACVALAAWLGPRRPGAAFVAMRDNEAAAMSIGVNPFRYRLLALTVAAAPVGGAATLLASYTAFLDPDMAFDPAISIEAQIAAIAGGLYTLPGPVLGAVVVTLLAEVARQWFGAHSASLLVFGAILVLLILFLPGGIVGGLGRLGRRRAAAGTPVAGASPAVAPPGER